MSIRRAKSELQKLKEVVAPKQPLGIYLRIEGETEGEALVRYGLVAWPEDALFIAVSRDDMAL